MNRAAWVALAHAHGISDSYTDWRGELQWVSEATLAALLAALGVAAPAEHAPEQHAPAGHQPADQAPLVAQVPANARQRCYVPDALEAGAHWWGVTAQLYSLRSADDWGLGDFATLREFVEHAAAAGAAFVGVNPLHALFPADARHVSPYSPSNRHYLNLLMIEVPRVPGYATCAAVQAEVRSAVFQARRAQLCALRYADAAGVMQLKWPLLRLLHAQFRSEQLAQGSALGAAFRAWCTAEGERLQWQVTFDALQGVLRGLDPQCWGWNSWPPEYQDPRSPAVQRFVLEQAAEVEFYAWLQWLAHRQLAAVQAQARHLGMPIGMYGDYAVGVNPGGAETWGDASAYCLQVGIGAPPDPLALLGQDWGIPPQSPLVLRATAAAAFRVLMRCNLRHFGALRLDHVMALFRQWWVPRGMRATAGGYVHYPLELLLEALGSESQAQQCLVIGEDLGTVPEAIRLALPAHAIHRYQVALFERSGGGEWRSPREYLARALAVWSTHDLPTLRGWWEGEDLVLRERLQLFPSEELREQLHWERGVDKWRVLEALRAEGLAPAQPTDGSGAFSLELVVALHRFLGRTHSALAAVQAEDLAMERDPVNVPGTDQEHPNWCRRLSVDVSALFTAAAPRAILAGLITGRQEAASSPALA